MKAFAMRHAWALFCFTAAAHFFSRPNLLGQLLMMAALFAVLASGVALVWSALTLWKHKDALRPVTHAFVIAGFVLGIYLGKSVRDWNFNRALPEYNKAVAWALAHAREDEIVVLDLPSEFSGLGRGVHVHSNARCGLMIDFYWGGGFPVKHIVRRYAQRPGFTDIPECRESWRGGRRLADHWFELRD